MAVAVPVATMHRVGLITAAAIRAGSMESGAAVETPAAEAAAVATAAAGNGATAPTTSSSSTAAAAAAASASASAARIGADRSERQGASYEKYGYCSFD
jgi:hypothetical protein